MKKLAIGLGVVVALIVLIALVGGKGNDATPVAEIPDDSLAGKSSETKNTQKPAGYPSDIPTANGAYDFTYAKSGNHEFFGYSLAITKDTKTQFEEVKMSVLAAGWKADPTQTVQSQETIVTTVLMKGNESMAITVQKTKDELSSTDVYNVGFNRSPKGA